MLRLKELRKQKHISQQALAKAVGSSQSSINSYENNVYEPDITMLIKLANFFGVSIDYLICNNEIPYPVKSAERYMLNEKESEFIEIVRKISPEQEAILFEIMKQFVKAQEPAKKSLSEIKK